MHNMFATSRQVTKNNQPIKVTLQECIDVSIVDW